MKATVEQFNETTLSSKQTKNIINSRLLLRSEYRHAPFPLILQTSVSIWIIEIQQLLQLEIRGSFYVSFKVKN